ncbi:hypothetical protein HOO54_13805 [Bacillus sp. WMMC1349]|uniref:hypothetical protein n=1 Tax=Bacillus sp. WMMC1349 TaxID=2736254 RepID=UPI001551F42F|nr:hypothetical protein [Bacillus sp. WMMC1349]NPC93277.1 hypothetical protein [Bacillus sp. WMMC1349]
MENIDVEENQDGISTQAWWTANGCSPSGYQHCGGNCGYGLDHGGDSQLMQQTDVTPYLATEIIAAIKS